MQGRALYLSVIVLFLLAAPVRAQQGHPLTGSWHGEWGVPGSSDSMDLTLIVDWDGALLTGLVNPVTDRAALQNAELDSSNWTVHFEVDVKGPSGNTVHCIADGRLDRLGSDRRTIAGDWNCGDLRARFQLTRDRDY